MFSLVNISACSHRFRPNYLTLLMKRLLLSTFTLLAIIVLVVSACVHKPFTTTIANDGSFPQDIAKIIVGKCAISGCHNAASYTNCDNLLLDTWEHMFDGDNSGAVIVPFSPEYSPLLYFVNTDSSRGVVATPTMPVNTSAMPQSPLTADEYNKLKAWIAAGAPDKNGNIAFASDVATRQKIYITQQGCDLMAVIDAQKHVVMRYIPIGMSTSIENPHCTRVSSDGNYAYVSFLNGNYVQKIDTRTDQVIGNASVGTGAWNILYIAPGDTALLTSNWQSDGTLAFTNTANMQVESILGGGFTFEYPHGITSNATYDTFFITAQIGNVVYKINRSASLYKMISLDGNPPSTSTASGTAPNPHEILMTPDHSRYFVTCQTTNEVRVMDAHADTLITAIPVGIFPQEMAISTTHPYIFVTCQEDISMIPGRKGSVYMINYLTMEKQVIYGDFYQPHGITVDDRNGTIYIASINSDAGGPAPHHATACTGKAGWYTVYNLNTLQPLDSKRYQVTVFPYSVAARFK